MPGHRKIQCHALSACNSDPAKRCFSCLSTVDSTFPKPKRHAKNRLNPQNMEETRRFSAPYRPCPEYLAVERDTTTRHTHSAQPIQAGGKSASCLRRLTARVLPMGL
ncbi:hypothetical protein SL1157_3405 [Ruegeria lacuscaerulensis ITI-1157]|nr:hypothetical protein SL1157_3405 [Ruegeria lacuscaerulensis ITI-1157]